MSCAFLTAFYLTFQNQDTMKNFLTIAALALALISCDKSKQKLEAGSGGFYGFDEPHRLQYHFSPPQMWMNDPNGMVYYKGEYHLFYQHYPEGNKWGPMHWGHAISKDLIHWEHMPIALYPDEWGMIFSGSAVVDFHNTSGLGTSENPPLVAIFTYHSAEKEKEGREDYQTQGIAFSLDNGRTWEKYKHNPVLLNPGIKDFRDPKVSWLEDGNKWIMTLAVKDRIHFYSSDNLIDWRFESEFGVDIGAHGGVWECPDLFRLNVEGSNQEKWVLLVSINPGAPNGGSGTQYFVGNFDGSKFTLDQNFKQNILEDKSGGIWIDYGRDNYAGVTWFGAPGDQKIFIGWMSNWSYANDVPTEKWRSALTIPRTLSLTETEAGIRLRSIPIDLDPIRNKEHRIEDQEVNEVVLLSEGIDVSSSLFELQLDVEPLVSGNSFIVELSNDLNEKILFGYDVEKQAYFTDRSKAGKKSFSDNFAGMHYGPRINTNPEHSFKMLVDLSSMEVFADNYTVVMTDIFFPNKEFSKIKIYPVNGPVKIKNGKITTLSSIWKDAKVLSLK